MKIWILMSLLAFCVFLHAEDTNKVFLSSDKLYFNEKGIFLKKGNCMFSLPFIAYDEKVQGYYLLTNERAGVTLTPCGACRQPTWWIERSCCLNDICAYYCY